MNEGLDSELRSRKLREASATLPIVGTFLMMPPFIRIFASGDKLAGIPLIVVYIFAVWFALILLAWRLARPLREAMQEEALRSGEPDVPEA